MNKTLKIIIGSLLFIYICNGYTSDKPTGATLMQACKKMLNEQADNTTKMLCHWYVTPCDCQFGKDETLPRVCLPLNADAIDLARMIIQELQTNKELQGLPAETAAASILAPLYPCKDE